MNNRILISVLAAIGASAAFYMFALKPKRDEGSRLQGEITTAQSTLDAARQALAGNEKAKASYEQAYTSVVRLGKAVPADDDVRSLMVQLDAAARQTKVDFRSIDVTGGSSAPAAGSVGAASLPPGVSVGPAGFPAMPFTFSFNGSFFSLSSFFNELGDFVALSNKSLDVNGRLLTIDSLSLEPDATGFPKIKAQVGATSFLVAPDQGATAGATAAGPAGAPAAADGAAPGTTPAVPSTATSTGVLR